MEKTIKLKAPLTAEAVCSLNAGDEVLISGVTYTARDMAHKRLISRRLSLMMPMEALFIINRGLHN